MMWGQLRHFLKSCEVSYKTEQSYFNPKYDIFQTLTR